MNRLSGTNMWIRDLETPAGLDVNDAAPAVRDASSREDVQLVRTALSNFLFPDDEGSFHDIIRDIALDEQEQGTGLEEPMTPVEPAPGEAGRRLLTGSSHHLSQPHSAVVVYDAVAVPDRDSLASEDLRALVRPIRIAIGQATSETDALQSDLRQLREASARLAEEYHRIDTGCRETEERSTMVAAAINDLERRLGPLERLRDASAQLAENYHRIDTGCRETEERSTMVAAAINDLERRLGPLERLRDASAQLAEDYHRIDTGCRETEERSTMVAAAINDLERRLGPLVAALNQRRRRGDAPRERLRRSERQNRSRHRACGRIGDTDRDAD